MLFILSLWCVHVEIHLEDNPLEELLNNRRNFLIDNGATDTAVVSDMEMYHEEK